MLSKSFKLVAVLPLMPFYGFLGQILVLIRAFVVFHFVAWCFAVCYCNFKSYI